MDVQTRMLDKAVLITVNGDFDASIWPSFEQDFKEILKKNPTHLIIHFSAIQAEIAERLKKLKLACGKLKTKLIISCSSCEGFDSSTQIGAIKACVKGPLGIRLTALLTLEDQKPKAEKQLKSIDTLILNQMNSLKMDEKQMLEEPLDENKLNERLFKLKREIARLHQLKNAFMREIEVLHDKESATGLETEDPMSALTADQKKGVADAESALLKAIKESGVFN